MRSLLRLVQSAPGIVAAAAERLSSRRGHRVTVGP